MDFESENTKAELEKKLSELRKKFEDLCEEIEKGLVDEYKSALPKIKGRFNIAFIFAKSDLERGDLKPAKEKLNTIEKKLNEIEAEFKRLAKIKETTVEPERKDIKKTTEQVKSLEKKLRVLSSTFISLLREGLANEEDAYKFNKYIGTAGKYLWENKLKLANNQLKEAERVIGEIKSRKRKALGSVAKNVVGRVVKIGGGAISKFRKGKGEEESREEEQEEETPPMKKRKEKIKKPKIGPLYCPICAEMGIRQKLDLNKMECPSNRHSLYCYNEFENKWKYLGREITPLAKISQEIRPLTREEAEQIVEKIEEKRERKGGIGKFTVEKFKNFFLRSERTRTTKGQPAREEEEKEHREKTPPPGEEKEGIKAELKAKLKRAYEYKPPKTFWKFDVSEFMGLLSLIIGVFLTLTGWLGGWFIGLSLIVVGLIFAPLGRMEFKHHLGLISFVTGIIIAFYVHFWGGIALAFLGFGLLVGDIFEPIGNVIKYIAAGALLILIVPPFLSWIGIEIDFVALGLLTIINSLFLYIFWGFEEGKSAKERLERELLEEELKLTKARKKWIMEKARNLKKRVIRRRGGEEEGEEEEE